MFKYLNSFISCFNNQIKEVDSKIVRRTMDTYFHSTDWPYQQTITKVETFETKKGLLIKIETHRPGLLIGTGGEFIDGLEKYLFIALNRTDITIDLKECMLWHGLHK